MKLIATEWYNIFSLTVPSTWIAFVLAALLTALLLYVKFGKDASSQFGDIVFLFLIVWKLSVVFTDFSNVIANPLTIIYFSGERTGVYIGILSIILVQLYRIIRRKPVLSLQIGVFAFISFYSTFAMLVVIFNRSSIILIILTIIAAFFMGYFNVQHKETVNKIFPFLIVFGVLHWILLSTVITTSIITSAIIGMSLLFYGKQQGLKMNKNVIKLGILALIFAGILVMINNVRINEHETINRVAIEKASDFSLQSISGEEIALADFKGKRVILNFWATWCPPCKAEMPHMQNYYEQYAQKHNAIVVAVNLSNQESGINKVRQFVSDYEITFPVLLDKNGTVSTQYGVITIPTTLILDEEGNIVQKITGPVSEDMLISLLKK